MRLNLPLTVVAVTVLGLSFSSVIYHFAVKLDQHTESELAAEEPESGHPVGAIYSVDSSTGPHREVALFFSGFGTARVLGHLQNNKEKTLIDFDKQLVTKVNTQTKWINTSKLEPFEYPPIINPKAARKMKADCIGSGISKSYPYHRWRKEQGADEWEVWTDDRDHFPVYYRSVHNGEVLSWTIINTWIDESVKTQETFFTTQADPPPPQPIAHEDQEKNSKRKKQADKKRRHSSRPS